MFSKWRSAVLLFVVLSFLCVSPFVGVCASAQKTQTYGLGVSVGDTASYTIISIPPGARFGGLRNGDIIDFKLQQIETVNVSTENNGNVLSYQQADCNGSLYMGRIYLGSIGSWFFAIPVGPNSTNYYDLLTPFLPVGPGFWEALSDLFPLLNVSTSDYQELLTSSSYWRAEVFIGNLSENILYHDYQMMTVNPFLGVVTYYEGYSTEEYTSTWGNNFTTNTFFSMSLVQESVASMFSPGIASSLVIVVPLPLGCLIVVLYALDVRRRKSDRAHRAEKVEEPQKELGGEGKETAKGRLLSDLSDRALLKIAESVSRDVRPGTERETLIKAIKDSMSVEEIEKKIAELG